MLKATSLITRKKTSENLDAASFLKCQSTHRLPKSESLVPSSGSRYQDNIFSIQSFGKYILKYNASGDFLYFDKDEQFQYNADPARYNVTPKLPQMTLLKKKLTTAYRQSIMKLRASLLMPDDKENLKDLVRGGATNKKFHAEDYMEAPKENYQHIEKVVIRWNKLGKKAIGGTVWERMNPKAFRVNQKEIDTIFSLKTNFDKLLEEEITDKRLCLLPEKRKLSVNILAAGLKMKPEDIIDIIHNATYKDIEEDRMWSLLTLVPTPDEEELLLNARQAGLEENLDPTDKYMLKLALESNLRMKIECAMTRNNFEKDLQDVSSAVTVINKIANQLKTNNKFHALLRGALDIGNFVNSKTKNNTKVIEGFKIDSLELFNSMKSSKVGFGTLMDFLIEKVVAAHDESNSSPWDVEAFQQEFPDLLNIFETIDVESIMEIFDGILASIENVEFLLQTQSTQLPSDFAQDMRAFLPYSKQEYGKLSTQVTSMKNNLSSLMTFLGEKSSASLQRHLFVLHTVFTFVKQVETSLDSLKERQQLLHKSKSMISNLTNTDDLEFRPLRWQKLTPAQVKNSFWESQYVSLSTTATRFDAKELYFRFGISKVEEQSEGVETDINQGQTLELLDAKRKFNVNILLKASKASAKEIISVIEDGKFMTTSEDLLQTFSNIAPTMEEVELLRVNWDKRDQVDDLHKIMMDLACHPELRSQLEAVSFLKTLESDGIPLIQDIKLIYQVVKEVIGSRWLLSVLQGIIAIGNAMNKETRFENALGFKLDIVTELRGVGVPTKNISLLEYIVETLQSNYKGRMNNHDMPKLLENDRISLEMLRERIQEFMSGFSHAEAVLKASIGNEKLKIFVEEFEKRWKSAVMLKKAIDENTERNKEALEVMMKYFGEKQTKSIKRQDAILSIIRCFSLDIQSVLDAPYIFLKENMPKVARSSVFVSRMTICAAKCQKTINKLRSEIYS